MEQVGSSTSKTSKTCFLLLTVFFAAGGHGPCLVNAGDPCFAGLNSYSSPGTCTALSSLTNFTGQVRYTITPTIPSEPLVCCSVEGKIPPNGGSTGHFWYPIGCTRLGAELSGVVTVVNEGTYKPRVNCEYKAEGRNFEWSYAPV